MKPINIGDPVTCWWASDKSGRDGVRKGQVTLVAGEYMTVRFGPGRGSTPALDEVEDFTEMTWDEGITWIRGHHDFDSAEVKALLASFALQ